MNSYQVNKSIDIREQMIVIFKNIYLNLEVLQFKSVEIKRK